MTAVFPIGRFWPANCARGNAGAIATRPPLIGASRSMMPGSSSNVSILQSRIDGLLASFAGENPYGVRDLEQAAQVIAQQCANILRTSVQVHAEYLLNIGKMEVEIEAEPS